MKKTIIAIIALSLLLIGSNAWWLYRSIDFGVSYTYLQDSHVSNEEALNQVIKVLPGLARQKYTREEIINGARLSSDKSEPFSKDGFIWVGRIGIRFDKNDKVVEVKKGWE